MSLIKKLKYKYITYPKLLRENDISLVSQNRKQIILNIKGKNNHISIGKISGKGKIHISVAGENNNITIGDIHLSKKLDIFIGQVHPNFGKIQNVNLSIGNNCSCEELTIITFNANNHITIGNQCMFSYGITIYNTDGHPVYQQGSDKIINKVKDLTIGNHVWCGANVTILKNTTIADNCILGWESVISGKFTTPHAVIAGNPARIVKENIDWDSDGSKGYVQNEVN